MDSIHRFSCFLSKFSPVGPVPRLTSTRIWLPVSPNAASANVFKILLVLVVDVHMVCKRVCLHQWTSRVCISRPGRTFEVIGPSQDTACKTTVEGSLRLGHRKKRVTQKRHDSCEISTLWKMLGFFIDLSVDLDLLEVRTLQRANAPLPKFYSWTTICFQAWCSLIFFWLKQNTLNIIKF